MNTLISYVLIFLAGVGLGIAYFAVLWVVVNKLTRIKYPGVFVFFTFLGRIALLLLLFYWLTQATWLSLVICLLGFVLGRIVFLRKIKLGTKISK